MNRLQNPIRCPEPTLDPVRRAWQEATERSTGIVSNETNVRVLVLSGDTVLEIHLLREIGHGVIATETRLETDPREITETESVVTETNRTTDTYRVVQTAVSLLGNTIRTVRRLVHAPVVDPRGGHEAIAATSTTADQSPHRKSGRPIHDGPEQNTGLVIPNLKRLTFLVTPVPTRLGLPPILENGHRSPRRPAPRRTQLYNAMTRIMNRILWKTSSVRYLHKFMMRALALFVHVAGVCTTPAPATSMPTLLRTMILQTISHRRMTGFRQTGLPADLLRVL
jgi:hypothetical protein